MDLRMTYWRFLTSVTTTRPRLARATTTPMFKKWDGAWNRAGDLSNDETGRGAGEPPAVDFT